MTSRCAVIIDRIVAQVLDHDAVALADVAPARLRSARWRSASANPIGCLRHGRRAPARARARDDR